MRRAAAFRQNDITRALRAAAQAGRDVSRVEIDPDGKIVLVLGKPLESESTTPDGSKIVL
jgi:hypothetical protein